MFTLSYTNRFLKDLKLIKKRSQKDFNLLNVFINQLSLTGVKGLEKKNFAHKLKGEYNDCWECHVKPDLLLLWIEITSENEIRLIRTGSHSDLFK
ncbi:type II toxin-antitoxin system YafQ family toxin [uncultured Mucilaginibacter sp.]|uniref:type II toxin-antitoxin system RelE/ParE family toxin n=1 Tax=uncultured Mucilaginibacter sp. TaxID=797541 RepID=UPI00344D377C